MAASFAGRLCAVLLLDAAAGAAQEINANPSNYRTLLRTLKAGDTLKLAPGKYPRMPIANLNGTKEAWITITSQSGSSAVIIGEADHNTVDIVNCSYLAIENLRIDSRGIPGAFGISAGEGTNSLTHHIRIDGNIFVGQNGGQQTDGISTKTPTWGWIIRNNRIIGAGTGLYLGSSDGTQPFVAGLIENNLIKDTIGYNMEIKHQVSIPSIPGMPMGPTTTIIRNNVFIKNDLASPDGDRPNLLLGGLPSSGPGSLSMYEVYGNVFLHNHREALFQASGRVTLHDNLFVDGPYTYPAVVLRNHDYPLKIAHVYNNTVYTSERGIYFGSRAQIDDAVVGNLVFALTPISGSIMHHSNNLIDSVENASKYVRMPSDDIGSMDFYPLSGKCQGPALDLSPFHMDADYTLDFNGTQKIQAKGGVVFRGAYAGEGTNPGWQLQSATKPPYVLSASPVITLVWVSPAGGQAGRITTVMLTGGNFVTGTTIAVSGDGIKVTEFTIASATQMTATLAISADAAAGTRYISVSAPSGVSNAIAFRVTPSRRQSLPAGRVAHGPQK